MREVSRAQASKPYRRPKLSPLGRLHLQTQGQGTGNTDGSSGMGLPDMGMTMSDRRAKQDIVRLGQLVEGLFVYLFDYLPEFRERHGHGRQLGLMADEVARILPAAVATGADGYLRVDYGLLGWAVPGGKGTGGPA